MKGSRRTRARQQSAIVQHAVYPPTIQGTASAKPAVKQPIPVCAVQPGRTLELRTSIGMLRARQLLQQQVSTSDDDEQTQPQAQRNRAQLKSARLQPLGIVEDELTSSQLCLGVIPARSSRCQRPRSSTTHGVQFYVSELQKKAPKGRQRSRSAILARTVDTEHLMKLLSVSKQTGFHPQNSPRDHNEHSTAGVQSPSTPVVLKPLPRAPVLKYDGELGIKVEVRGVHQAEQYTMNSKDATELSPRRQKLPPIAKTPSPIKPKSSYKQSSSSPTTTITPRRPSTTEPIRVSIVSVGEVVITEEQTRTRQHKRKNSARLSHGWSPPSTVEPITGSAMIGTSRQHSARSREGGAGEEDTPINPSNSMLIKVNVNEYLDGN